MRFPRWIRVGVLLAMGGLFVAENVFAKNPPPPPPDLNLATDLLDQGKYAESAAIRQQWLKLHPKDAGVWFHFGYALVLQADASGKPAEQKKLRKLAREALLKAKSLGSTHAMLEPLLAKIRPDGTGIEMKFSPHEKAAALMKQAELAFVRHDYDAAYELYQQTLALEPANYHALLFSGDVHFNRGHLEEACTWFAKAVAADPNQETAHRYWADATRKLGRNEESFSHLIDALVAEPYHPYPRKMIEVEMRRYGGPGRRIPLKLPVANFEIRKKEIMIKANATESAAATAYTLVCAAWRSAHFQEHFPKEKTPRHSLPEEIFALEFLLSSANQPDASGKPGLEEMKPELDLLAQIKADGLLECFAFFERADEELMRDYAAFRDGHRAELRRFLRKYWFKLPPDPVNAVPKP